MRPLRGFSQLVAREGGRNGLAGVCEATLGTRLIYPWLVHFQQQRGGVCRVQIQRSKVEEGATRVIGDKEVLSLRIRQQFFFLGSSAK